MKSNIDKIAKAMKEYCGADEMRVRHFVSVYTLAKTIGELEKLPQATQEYLEISALMSELRDIQGEKKLNTVKEILTKEQIDDDIIERVCHIITHYYDYDHITGLDHQILIEANLIVEFKEKNYDRYQIVKEASSRFMTNYGKAFLKRAFSV